MFQLFDLIMTSPIGVFIAGMAQDMIYAAFLTVMNAVSTIWVSCFSVEYSPRSSSASQFQS